MPLLHGCFFRGDSKKETPQPILLEQQKNPAIEKTPKPPDLGQEIEEAFHKFSREREAKYEDVIKRLEALEQDYQHLKESLSLLEHSQEGASVNAQKSREALEVRIETLREQLEEYNTLMLNILSKLSDRQEKKSTP